MRKRLMKFIIVLAAAYALLLLVSYVVQRKLIYLPSVTNPGDPWAPGFPAQEVTFPSTDGVRISGLFSEPPDADGPVLLIFHGNAGNVRSWSDQLRHYRRRGFGGLLLDPRGYGLSEGSPSEEGCIADGEAALAWLGGRGIAAERVVVHGISIGVGIAVPLAARNQLRGLILQSPFTDLPAVAQAVFFFLPCRLLLKDRYDNRALLSGVTESTLVIHGTRDRTIRLEQGRAVADALPNLSAFAEAKGYGHNDLLAWPGYWPRIEAYLRGSK